jgi:hypothetical protein
MITTPIRWALLALVLLLLTLRPAFTFYDPGVQRWVNRDPIEEYGGDSLYEPFDNDPIAVVDAQGLTVYLCARKSTKPSSCPIGNHVYFWDDSQPSYAEGGQPSCGMSSSSGQGTPGDRNHDLGPGIDDCQAITNDPGLGDKIMKCCMATANTGVWFPLINDCHNKVNNCLKHFNIMPPRHPRLGPPRIIVGPPPHRPPLRSPKDPGY